MRGCMWRGREVLRDNEIQITRRGEGARHCMSNRRGLLRRDLQERGIVLAAHTSLGAQADTT